VVVLLLHLNQSIMASVLLQRQDFSMDMTRPEQIEIRWHGRGGQGAVTSAGMLAEAAYYAGFKGVSSAPAFGAERRGAPVTASTRLANATLRHFSQVENPDMVVVLEDSLLVTANAVNGLGAKGYVIVNSHLAPEELGLSNGFRIATADADSVAEEIELRVSGVIMVNTAMLGAVAKATGLITLEHIERVLNHAFSPKAARKNIEAARMTYECTRCAY